ncbi:MAG: transposase [Anaerostipes sp.]|nr:transposase [Anaerostipes sp.]MDD3747689.1 transposase [Anaerostipes sp.]
MYSTETKISAVKEYIKTGDKGRTAKKYGVSLSTMDKWRRAYEKDGFEDKKEYSKEFKEKVVGDALVDGITASARNHKVTRDLVYKWLEEHNQNVKESRPKGKTQWHNIDGLNGYYA